MNYKCTKRNIYEICNVERAIGGKSYKAGSCYIKLSAVDEEVGQLSGPGAINPRYAVLEPKDNINIDYLYIAVCRSFPEFLAKYRTTINLQFETLKHFEICWHDKEDMQKHIVEAFESVQNEIELIEAQIEQEKKIKKWYLGKMMI